LILKIKTTKKELRVVLSIQTGCHMNNSKNYVVLITEKNDTAPFLLENLS
jgi:hypothetical protein